MQATKTGDGYVALSDAAEPPVKEPPNNQMLVDFLTPPVNIRLDSSGQHTLEWREPLTGPSRVSTHPAGQRVVTVPPGSLNLYAYPGSYSGPALDLIRRVLLEMAAKAPELFDVPDSVGAYALHALIVCNTEESLEVALSVVDKLPRLLLRTHDPPVFTGEGSLHIVCANRREAEACRMVDIAEQRLAADELAAFLNTQTTGVFFEKPPMCQYGDSPLSYACVFEVSARACLHSSTNHSRVCARRYPNSSTPPMRTLIPLAQLRTLVKRMLDTGHVSLDGRCGDFSGFYPIHAVTCQGLRGMYDYLTEGLPPEHRCDKLRLAETGQLALGTDQMTPLQLAAIRGLPYIFQHIMTKELTKILWIWGPVTQYQISLEGIDSAGHNASGTQAAPLARARACM